MPDRIVACALCRGILGGSSAYTALFAPERSKRVVAQWRRPVCLRWLSEIDQAGRVDGRNNVAAGEIKGGWPVPSCVCVLASDALNNQIRTFHTLERYGIGTL